MKRAIYVLVIATVVISSGALIAQDDGLAGVARLFQEARYEEASDLMATTSGSGPADNWWRARLTQDPDQFQELALAVVQDAATPAELGRDVTLARAREHFAAGRYQSAEGLLKPLAEGRDPLDPAARLWWGMSLQASGEARAAAQAFESIPERADEFAVAQALLADLNLRAQRPKRAREHAENSLAADRTAGAIALGVLEQLARAEGDADRSGQIAGRLADDYPRSVELTWARSAIPETVSDDSGDDVVQAVEDDGSRRSFALQYGAFRDRALALRRIRQLEGEVADLRLEVDREQSPPLYRVVGGSFGTRAQAERARDRLASRGIEAFILAPER
jgi:tetratricopeptide (TPR) repeat protein